MNAVAMIKLDSLKDRYTLNQNLITSCQVSNYHIISFIFQVFREGHNSAQAVFQGALHLQQYNAKVDNYYKLFNYIMENI